MILDKKKKKPQEVIPVVTPAFCLKVYSRQQYKKWSLGKAWLYCWAQEAEFSAKPSEGVENRSVGYWGKGYHTEKSIVKCMENATAAHIQDATAWNPVIGKLSTEQRSHGSKNTEI